MKIFDLILSRRTVHSFTSEEVSKALIEKTVLAGVHALNHRHTWPWKFYSIGVTTRLKLAHLAVKFKSEKSTEALSEVAVKATVNKFMESGAFLVLGLKKCEDPEIARENYAAMACAVQNMSLYLASESYGSKWGTGKLTRMNETYEILGVDKNKIEIQGFFWIGKAKIEPVKPERPSLEEFLIYI